MAPNRMLAIFAIAAVAVAIFPAVGNATDYIVGDGKGWTVGFDYQAWAADKVFYVGDTIEFNYPIGVHNVYRANVTEFINCSVPDNAIPLTGGKDVIRLAFPGNKWYFCGVSQHCANGQKLKITVMPTPVQDMSPLSAPAPAPSSGC